MLGPAESVTAGERELVLRWTAPTMIHGEMGAEDNVVVYPIKDRKK